MEKIKRLATLFLTFFKIGLFTFGGGYAMISLIEREFVTKKKWIEHNEFLDVIAIAEATPGPIAINMSTYMGYKRAKVWGAFVSTLAVCIPSLVIIYVISLFLNAFMQFSLVAYAFKGIQVCVVYLIASAGIRMLKKMERSAMNWILFIATLGCMIAFSLFAVNFSSVFYVLISGVIGLSLYLMRRMMRGKKNKAAQKQRLAHNEEPEQADLPTLNPDALPTHVQTDLSATDCTDTTQQMDSAAENICFAQKNTDSIHKTIPSEQKKEEQ